MFKSSGLFRLGSEQTMDDPTRRQEEEEETSHGVSDGLFVRGRALHNLSNKEQ